MPNRRLLVALIAAFSALILLPASASALKFENPGTAAFGSPVSDVATGDFNGDGRDDVAIAAGNDPSLQPGIQIRLSTAGGSWSGAPSLDCGSGGSGCYSLVVGNFAAGPALDIFAVPFQSNAEVLSFIGDGTGGFTRVSLSSPVVPIGTRNSIATGDLNDDGLDDVVIGGAGGNYAVGLAEGSGTFSFTSGSAGQSNAIQSATIGDFDDDANNDLALGDGNSRINVLLGDGNGTFTPSPDNPVMVPGNPSVVTSMVTADFNEDGKDDVGMTGALAQFALARTVKTFLGTEDGIALNPSSSGDFDSGCCAPGPNQFSELVTADFNADGIEGDLGWLQIYQPNGQNFYQEEIKLSDGQGNFETAPGSPYSWQLAQNESHNLWGQAVGDFNGDGGPDLVGADTGGGGCNGCAARLLINAPDLATDVTSVDFGDQLVGTTSDYSTINLINQGGVPATLDNFMLEGPDEGMFGVNEETSIDCLETLAPNESCPLEVNFTPSSEGSKTTSFQLFTGGNDEDPFAEVALTGEGVAPGVTVEPGAIEFSEVRIDTTGTETVTITSSGTGPLAIGELALTGTDVSAFSLTDDTCSGTDLDPTETCTVKVNVSPTETGSLAATLEVPNDAESDTEVAITAEAVDPVISIDPTSAVLPSAEIGGVGQVGQFTVTSDGTTPLHIGNAVFSGTDAADFTTMSNNNCEGKTLQPEATCTFFVVFHPNGGSAGTRTATLTLGSDAGGAVVSLSATATNGDTVITPNPLTIGETKTGETTTETITLTAAGTADMYLRNKPALSGPDAGDFTVVEGSGNDDDCWEQQTPAGQSCEIEVAFSPAAIGSRAATLTIDSFTQVQDVELTGTGINPAGTLTPATHDFGSAEIGAASGHPTQDFTLTSTGTTPLEVGAFFNSIEENAFTFAGEGTCVGKSLAPGLSCKVTVTFDPKTGEAGGRTGSVGFGTNAGEKRATFEGTATKLPVPPPDPVTSATLKLKSAGKVKRGKKLAVTATVTNTGNTTITGLTLKTTVPKKFAKVPKATKVSSLAPGATVKRAIKIAVKKKAKAGKKLKLTVTATAGGVKLATAKRTAKIKK